MKKKLIITICIILAIPILLVCLVPEAYDHIYGYFLFRKIGSNLTINIEDDFDKATAVAFWVFENIKQLERYPHIAVIDDNFLNIYKRGFGFCDQGAHVYATMMHWLGFEVKTLQIRKEDGTSSHTVAVVKVNGKFMIVDTTYHFIFAEGRGKPLGYDELENTKVFEKYTNVIDTTRASFNLKPIEMKASWFKNGTFVETFPYADTKYIIKKILEKIKGRWQQILSTA